MKHGDLRRNRFFIQERNRRNSGFGLMLEQTRLFIGSPFFSGIMFICAAVVVLTGNEIIGVPVFICIMSLLLFISRDTAPTMLPFMLMCMFVTKCYDSFDTFIKLAPMAVIPIAALIFHFVRYRGKFSVGPSFSGVCAAAAAVTLGGAFSISASEYFSPTSLYYVFGLGAGMVLLYLILRYAYVGKRDEGYDPVLRFAATMYIAGLFGVFMVASHYAMNFSDIIQAEKAEIQWSNNISTMLMFAMPFPFYFAVKGNPMHVFSGLAIYIAAFATGSRGGILMGVVELLLCVIYFFASSRRLSVRIGTLCAIAVMAAVIFLARDQIIAFASLLKILPSELPNWREEARGKLIKRALEDFLSSPIFGKGLGYTGNTDIYNPVTGAGNWYHMMPFQIIGSLGIVGILCYGYQILNRLVVIFTRPGVKKLALALSYSGIFLMSMVNPGEFCPIPYEMLTVLLFILMESEDSLQHPQRVFLYPDFRKILRMRQPAETTENDDLNDSSL